MSESVPPAARSDPATCRHRWRIDPPNGPTVQGECRYCGAKREFPTTTSENVWETTSERQQRS